MTRWAWRLLRREWRQQILVLALLALTVAAAAFAVIAARRQRQLGMLAAIGATRKQLRMVMVAGGALVGIIAAVTGAVIGLAAWFAAAPHLEAFAGHRIDRFAVPWDLVVLGMLLAILTAAGAAWWPARAASRVPVVNALSARPLKPRPARRTAIMAVLLIVLALATAGTLALLGALLGSGAAYLALAAGHRSDISVLSRVPVLDLAITIAGVPAAAALVGWSTRPHT